MSNGDPERFFAHSMRPLRLNLFIKNKQIINSV